MERHLIAPGGGEFVPNRDGSYEIATATGAIGAGLSAASELLQFRWTSTTQRALVHSVEVTGMYATTAFVAGAINLGLFVARSWSADGTGGTALTLTAPAGKLSNPMPATGATIRIATTAALGAGTKTLDSNAHGQILSHSSAGTSAATPIIGSTYLPHRVLHDGFAHPLMLKANEGFVVTATVPGTGVWIVGFKIHWSEATL